jgi:homoserine dehydrogenase
VIEVLKFGSSVLRSSDDLPVAVDEIYRRWRAGYRVLAVVSAFEGVTDRLLREVAAAVGNDSDEATASYVATGEQRTAALLVGALHQHGMPARIVDAREIGLAAAGTTLDSVPTGVNAAAIERHWQDHDILVLPGFYGVDPEGRIALFGRGGSDLSALFLAAALRAECRLLKDVAGVFEADPAAHPDARRYATLSWQSAIRMAGPLIQPKALELARQLGLSFEVGRPSESVCTKVGLAEDVLASVLPSSPPLRVALVGCGTVGRGVYERLKRYPQGFVVGHVIVRELSRHRDVPEATVDPAAAAGDAIDVLVICGGDASFAYSLAEGALRAGKFVVTANKAMVAAHGASLQTFLNDGRLRCSAAVGGAVPVLETLARVKTGVREIRGIINSTSSVILDEIARGSSLPDAIATARARGYAEENPTRDLSGEDSADKLAIAIGTAFGEWIDPARIPTRGVDGIHGGHDRHRLIATATAADGRIAARVEPEPQPSSSYLGAARGPENRVEIELASGEVIRLRGQGAGRWPTTASVMADLQEVARNGVRPPSTSAASVHEVMPNR